MNTQVGIWGFWVLSAAPSFLRLCTAKPSYLLYLRVSAPCSQLRESAGLWYSLPSSPPDKTGPKSFIFYYIPCQRRISVAYVFFIPTSRWKEPCNITNIFHEEGKNNEAAKPWNHGIWNSLFLEPCVSYPIGKLVPVERHTVLPCRGIANYIAIQKGASFLYREGKVKH